MADASRRPDVDQPPIRTSRRIRAERARSRPHGLGAMLLAFSVIFVLAWVFIVRQPPAPPAPTLGTVTGSYTWKTVSAGRGGAGTFAAIRGGDARGTFEPHGGEGAQVESTYDAGTRRAATLLGGDGGADATVTIGAWPPAWRVATHSPLDYQGLSAIVRAAVEDGDSAVGTKPLRQDGREVWRAAVTLGGTTMELVVDQASGLVTWYSDGVSEFTADVAWGEAPAMGSPTPSPGATAPAGVLTVDHSYTYVPALPAAAAAAGFTPVVSGLAPDGFVQAAVATAPSGDAPVSWQPDGPANGRSQIVQLYLRGLTWFEVRQVGRGPEDESAALAHAVQTARATGLSFQQTQLQYGTFAGRQASTWYAPSGPTLLVGDGRRAVYVTGTLTRQELLSLAEGFKPLEGGAAAEPGASPAGAASPAQAP